MQLSKDVLEFLSLANLKKIDYIIVGAWALAFHGTPRYTGDVDILLKVSEENADKIMEVLNDFGFGGIGILKDDFLKEGQVIQLGYPPNRIDLLTEISGVKFDDAWKNKSTIKIENTNLNFLGVEELIKNKSATGRKKDIADVEILKKIIKNKKS